MLQALQLGVSVTATLAGAAQAIDLPAVSLDKGKFTSTAVGVNGTFETYSGANALFASYQVGDWILVSGFSTGANNGRKKITAKSSDETTTLITVASNLTTEAAGASATFVRLRLPSFVAVVANAAGAADATVRPWGVHHGTAPLAALNMLLPLGSLVILDVSGYDQLVVEGTSGALSITALGNG
jgi:hypothetical protein